MVTFRSKLFLFFFLQCSFYSDAQEKPKLTVDEFLDYVEFPAMAFSSSGEHLLLQVLKPIWNESSYQHSLWVYDVQQEAMKLITMDLNPTLSPRWSPDGKWLSFFVEKDASINTNVSSTTAKNHLQLYCVETQNTFSIDIGPIQPTSYIWSDHDDVLYFTSNRKDPINTTEWHNVIDYRSIHPQSQIHRIDVDIEGSNPTATTTLIANITFTVTELVYVPNSEQLVFGSRSTLYEDLENFELYSIDLTKPQSSLLRLTDFEGVEQELKLSTDGEQILFRLWALSSGKVTVTQRRIFSLNLNNGRIERLAKDFNGLVTQFKIKPDGGVYFLGQLGLEVQIYSQQSSNSSSIRRSTWNGSYESLAVTSGDASGPIAFVFSSFDRPKEVYLVNSIDQLSSAKAITNFNELFTRRSLPHSKGYRWINTDDGKQIEGVLHYPPGLFETKNLSLLVLMHGGPFAASLNEFQANWYNWALMAATEGWLVLEPNYRGSTGYGDQFLLDIRSRLLSLPGQDILMGVDQLIEEGIADPKRLAVGGYSYGGFLTNWLITQTTRFNAALSGAGDIEHVSGWGTMDLPLLIGYLHGGFPWEVPSVYQYESPIYNLHKVRTPTFIVTGEIDVRVKPEQSYILERGLHYLGIPTQLLILSNEGHDLERNPWSGKITLREELKWLQRYGHESWTNGCDKIGFTWIGFVTIIITSMRLM